MKAALSLPKEQTAVTSHKAAVGTHNKDDGFGAFLRCVISRFLLQETESNLLASVNIAFLSLFTVRLVLGTVSVSFLMLSYKNISIVFENMQFYVNSNY